MNNIVCHAIAHFHPTLFAQCPTNQDRKKCIMSEGKGQGRVGGDTSLLFVMRSWRTHMDVCVYGAGH